MTKPSRKIIVARAETMLAELQLLEKKIEASEAAISQEMAALVVLTDELAKEKESLNLMNKKFKKFVNKHREAIFIEPKKLVFESGWVAWVSNSKLHLPKNAVENIKAAGDGFEDGIRIVEEAARDVIDKWPAEKLTAIGAERRPFNEIKWETKK